jgi:hypothetical protein
MSRQAQQEYRTAGAPRTDSIGSRTAGGLDEETHARLTQFFGGASFHDVQIVPNSHLAVQYHADALAQGNTLYFAPGHFDPTTATGFGLLAHELTHYQQTQRGANAALQGAGGPSDLRQALEEEAYATQARAASAFSGLGAVPIQAACGPACECAQCQGKKKGPSAANAAPA